MAMSGALRAELSLFSAAENIRLGQGAATCFASGWTDHKIAYCGRGIEILEGTRWS